MKLEKVAQLMILYRTEMIMRRNPLQEFPPER